MLKFPLGIMSCLWQLPQNIAGLLFLKISKARQSGSCYLFESNFLSSVSLGEYIFIRTRNGRIPDGKTLLHEEGHQKQSRILGPFYLIAIGLPSALGNLIFRIGFVKKRFDYYRQPWEAWADKLGGVKR